MRYAVVAAGLAASVNAWGPGGNWGPPGQWSAPSDYSGDWTTQVVSQWTTYCPEATQWTHSGKTFTATEATTMTITNCPYTVSVPATSWSSPAPPESSPVTYSSAPPATWTTTAAPPPPVTSSPVTSAAPPAPYPVGNSTAPAVATTGSPAYPSSPVATNAASQLSAAGAGILAIFGLVAAL